MVADPPLAHDPPAEPEKRRRGRGIWYVLGGFLFVFLGGSLLLWFLRKPVAEQALAAWCAERDLECDAKFTELDTSGLTVSAVKVSSGGAVPAEAAHLRADIRWAGLFTPQVTGVTVNGLFLRGTLDEQGLRFGGLERLVQAGGGGGPTPTIDIRDARILLDTPAGQTSATLNAAGILPRNGSLSLQIDPGLLSNPFARAEIQEGRLDVRAVDGQIDAELGLSIRQAAHADFGLDTFELLARADFHEDAGHPGALEWSLRAARIASPDLRATDIRTNGQATFAALPEMSLAGALNELTGAVFEGEAASLTLAGYTFDSARFGGELAGRAGDVSGPLIVSTGIVTGPSGSAAGLSLAGEMERRTGGAASFDGKVSVSGAALDGSLRTRFGAAFSLPGVLSGHADVLRASLSRALTKFDAATDVAMNTDGSTYTASALGTGRLDAASGFSLKIAPGDDQAWVSVRRDGVTAQGAVTVSGGGAPSVSMDVRRLALGSGALTLEADALRLSSWSVDGRTLSANLKDISLDSLPGDLAVAATGEIAFAGEAGGVTLAPTTLTGGLDAARDASGWRAQSVGPACLSVNSRGLTLGAIAMAPARLAICPVNGRFLRQGSAPAGAAKLGDLRLPFTMESGTGVLSLSGAEIDWSAQQGFALTVSAETLDLPLIIGERTLTIAGSAPRINVATGKGPARIAARLGATRFGGTMVPANVSAGAFSFDGVSAASGVEGKVAGDGVLITDLNIDDPLYKPVISEFSGTIGDNRLRITGPLQLQAKAVPLADASLDLDILKLDGTARVVSQPLVFRSGGLQPDMISGRLIGLFTDATGSMASDARFTITNGKIAGTAEVRVQNFGFQTTRLGRVTGVNGTAVFADLMGLTTAPDQVFTVAGVNPGIPLTDGRIVYDLRPGGLLHLDSVTFPFGGGTLAIDPFDWALDGGLQDQSVAVTAKAIRLEQLVEVLKLPDTKATGTLSGTFPLVFAGNRVQIKDAVLRADAPGGRLSYTGGAVDAAANQDANASLAFDALRDLKFEVLQLGINGDLAGDLRADLLLIGENINPLPMGNRLTLPPGQAFEFAIGFDLPIGKLIDNNLGFMNQQDLIDATLDLLNGEQVTRDVEAEKADRPAGE
ncbi:MAG: YdbH domain-containing protein [Hyphomonas sp.]